MDGTIRVRTAAWFATAVVLSVFATLLVMQEWRANAAPGDSDATWVAVEPCRLFDYRPGEEPIEGKKTPLVAGAPATQQVTGNVGNCSIPTVGVVAVSMNVTVVQGTAQSNLRLYPADAANEPVVSNLNWLAGDSATANKVDVKLSASGAVRVAVANGTVNVVGDVVGYYTDTSLKALQGDIDALEASKADTTRTVTFSGQHLTGLLDFQTGSINGCTADRTGRNGVLMLPIPVGSTILNVTGTFYDRSGPAEYEAILQRVTTGATNSSSVDLTTVTGGELSVATTTKDLTPPSETVDPGERFQVSFDDGVDSFGSGLCSVAVTYRESAAEVPLVSPLSEQSGAIECDDVESCRVEVP